MRIIWAPSALEDLRGIESWLTLNASAETALRVLSAIRDRARFLESFPMGGRPFEKGERVLVIDHTPYLLRYRTLPDDVEVIRVHHEREPWQSAR